MNIFRCYFLFPAAILLSAAATAQTGTVEGAVIDRQTREPLPGATILIAGRGFSTGGDGKFSAALPKGTYSLACSYISYIPTNIENINVQESRTLVLNIELEPDVTGLKEVTVVAARRENTELSVMNTIRTATVSMSGISAQSLRRAQDRDASEAVKRVSGISIIGDRFVIVRGLAQRYNNAWINGMALPSSEADSRAFSFDVIPSSQIDNIMIVKSPAAEYPADCSGGFVMIRTKTVPDENSIQVSYGTGFNAETHFRGFMRSEGGATDFLGFDNGLRQLKNVPSRVDNSDVALVDRVTKTGFNNSWTVNKVAPMPDQRLNAVVNRFFTVSQDKKAGMTVALNYSYTNKTVWDMDNAEFGAYSASIDQPMYRFHYRDNQYNADAKLGALANFSFVSGSADGNFHKFEFRNIFNQLGRNRYTFREGTEDVSGYYEQRQEEYFYQSRSSYGGQLSGDHLFGGSKHNVTWNAGYAYSNRYQPDRRIVERRKDDSNGGQYALDQSDFQRYFTQLDENVLSTALNYVRKITPANDKSLEIKAGLYGAFTARSYSTRKFIYKWLLSGSSLPAGYETLPTEQAMSPEYLGAPDKVHIMDETDVTDDYAADASMLAGYAAINAPVGRFNFYAGVRFERKATVMTSFPQVNRPHYKNYEYSDIFPSLNASFSVAQNSLLRFAYGITVNRPELRELTESTYYDFEIFSRIKGNPDLKQATVHNVDLRYEHYLTGGDMFSVAAFFKRFLNPIEITLKRTGGKPQFSCDNALDANSFGVEIDARKRLDFAGMDNLTATLNVTLAKSILHYGAGSAEHDRPMQGQSPYIVNFGLFYRSPKDALSVGLFYNRIGERIVGLGTVSNSSGGDGSNDVPDLYELPRNLIDLSATLRLNRTFELRGSVRDMLAERIECAQYPTFTDAGNRVQKRTQITKSYKPGQSFILTLSATF